MDIVPLLLLVLFGATLAIGMGVIFRVCGPRQSTGGELVESATEGLAETSSLYLHRPSCWLAVKSRDVRAVKRAFGLQKAKPCSWIQGLCRDEKAFISPPVRGWILVFGSDLPDPADDVDTCFRFIVRISRQLGHVQFFSASRVLQHHAWIRAEKGRIIRAYAWAGKTLWQQGQSTVAEEELDLLCMDYCEEPDEQEPGLTDAITTNVEKVPSLAARWSLDPGRLSDRFLEAEFGVAGEPAFPW